MPDSDPADATYWSVGSYCVIVLETAPLLQELTVDVERLLERHLATSKEWFPHEYVPYGRGRDATPGETWCESDADLAGATIDEAVRSSLLVNLLTEDNLPYYFRTVEQMLGSDGAWGEWVRRWTAEEGRHSMAIYGYLMVTRAVDPVLLERCRMAQVSGGVTPSPPTLQEGLVYLSLQELATRIAHRATGRMMGDPAGYEVMSRVAADENLHQLFYRDLASAALAVDPDGMVMAMERQVRSFSMPGTGIPGFAEHAKRIAHAGIYDLAVHHDQILVPVIMRTWGLEQVEGLSPEADQARTRLVAHLAKSERVARRVTERRERELSVA